MSARQCEGTFLRLGQVPHHLVVRPVVLPCLQGACDHQAVEEAAGLLGGVPAQAGEGVHVGAAFGTGAGVCGQRESGQPQRRRCGRQDQRNRPQRCGAAGSVS
jgi:hypothetical protein